jgi:hypothetical protein
MTRAPVLTHHAPVAPSWLDIPVGPAGIALGLERPGVPALARLFRPRPTTVGVFGSAVLARVIALRAFGAGAHVCVVTPRPAPWAALYPLAPTPGPWLTLLPPGSEVAEPGTGRLPWLLIDEAGQGVLPARYEPGPWRAAVTAHPPLAPQAVGSVRSYDLLVVSRVAGPAVEPLRAATGLPERSAKWLSRMPDEVVALIAGGEARYATLALDPTERAALRMSPVTPR